ncbi:MAG TPA: hypothetical protein VJQ43_02520, partial [Thermoplasmata archaeon]|nr:hypothetical protein [Thermoplasmata archaeon]
MYPGSAGYRPKPPSQGTAETLALIGWVFQLIFSLIYIGLGVLFVIAGAAFFLFVSVAGPVVIVFGALLV